MIDDFIKSEGQKYTPMYIIRVLENMKSPYSIRKLIELSNENFEIGVMSDGESSSIENLVLTSL